MSVLLVVGASLAGLSAVRAARAQGFEGRIVVVGDEPHRPYDRPPLSKALLRGEVDAAELALETAGEELDAEWLLGRRAVGLDVGARTVSLDDGRSLRAEHILLATGARARHLAVPGAESTGVHTLRTLDDAVALRSDLLAAGEPSMRAGATAGGGGRLVVIGAGWIGAEVASTARSLGLAVTLLEAAPLPLIPALGPEVARAVAALPARHGVDARHGVQVKALESGPDGRVTAVRLAGGERLAADVVVAGVGSLPNVEWLDGSGLEHTGGVVCDAAGRTGAQGISAVGDCAAWPDPVAGLPRRTEHWSDALERPAIAVAALLGTGSEVPGAAPAPYVWSEQFGGRVLFAGRATAEVTLEEGDLDGDRWLAAYHHEGAVVGAVALSLPRPFVRLRRQIGPAWPR
ncbi:MAG: FAD-dependent oxidoreductase [Micrococcales bacterium]|nr:FAD-dependent oxidoreductase [Micrococcales bacterium]